MYTTVQGDTFDSIALKVYGSEKFADVLMKNNPELINRVIFSANIKLNIPEIQKETINNSLPPWRK